MFRFSLSLLCPLCPAVGVLVILFVSFSIAKIVIFFHICKFFGGFMSVFSARSSMVLAVSSVFSVLMIVNGGGGLGLVSLKKGGVRPP